jgi:hypothetical protein
MAYGELTGSLAAWFKKGSDTVVRSTPRAVAATVPDRFLNQAFLALWIVYRRSLVSAAIRN